MKIPRKLFFIGLPLLGLLIFGTWWFYEQQQWLTTSSPNGYAYSYPKSWQAADRVIQESDHLDKNEGLYFRLKKSSEANCRGLEECVMKRMTAYPPEDAYFGSAGQPYRYLTVPTRLFVGKKEFFVQRLEYNNGHLEERYWYYQDNVIAMIGHGSSRGYFIATPAVMRRLLASFTLTLMK